MPKDSIPERARAPRNRTLTVSGAEADELRRLIEDGDVPVTDNGRSDRLIRGDAFKVLEKLPAGKFDLLFADPPYNLTKNFGTRTFARRTQAKYEEWLDAWLELWFLLKPTASVLCGDWRSGSAIERAASRYFTLRTRITWSVKRAAEQGELEELRRGHLVLTVSEEFTFNLDAVKQRRRVLCSLSRER